MVGETEEKRAGRQTGRMKNVTCGGYSLFVKGLKSCVCTQDIEVEMPATIPCAVRCQAAVPASVCNLGAGDLEETAVR